MLSKSLFGCARRLQRLPCPPMHHVAPAGRAPFAPVSIRGFASQACCFHPILARLYNSKSAADKPSDYLSTNQRHMGFDKPAHPYLAAVLVSPCATSRKPVQMMNGK